MLEPASILTLEINRRLLLRFQTGNAGLKLSQYPFSQGLPGSMYNVPVPSFPSH